MSLSASSIVKPVVQQYLSSLSHLVDKAQSFSAEKGLDEQVLLQTRLAPDMHPFIWQVQMISEFCARCVARMAELELPNVPFEETTYDQLKQRIEDMQTFVANVDDELIDAAMEKEQTVQLGPDRSVTFKGPVYLNHFFLPNLFFHITTAYNILRSNGVDIGKFDYIGQMPS
ncbi:MAG: DUF1993 domain-containing protein [Aliiglaciecola sp.]